MKREKRTALNVAHPGVGAETQVVIQAAINSGASDVRITNKSENGVSSDWIVASPIGDPNQDNENALPALAGASNQVLTLAKGVRLLIKAGSFLGTQQKMLGFLNKSNCYVVFEPGSKILMGGVTVFGTYAIPVAPYTAAEWRHALSFQGCTRYGANGANENHLDGAGGDGLYVGSSPGTFATCTDGRFQDMKMRGNLRQGTSIISARRLNFLRCNFNDTHGVAPQSGADLEPYDIDHVLEEIVFDKCEWNNNVAQNIKVALDLMTHASPTMSVTFRNFVVSRGATAAPWGAHLKVLPGAPTGGTITFEDFTIRDLDEAALRIEWNIESNAILTFRRGVLSNCSIPNTDKMIDVVIAGNPASRGTGYVKFEDMLVVDPLDRQCLRLNPDPIGGGEPTIRGTIDVIKTGAAPLIVQANASLPNLAFRSSNSRNAKRLTVGRALFKRRGGNRKTIHRASRET